MRFLETITFLGNEALIPIDKIKYINLSATERGYVIRITGYDGDWEEHYSNSDSDVKKCELRFKMIKKIIEAA